MGSFIEEILKGGGAPSGDMLDVLKEMLGGGSSTRERQTSEESVIPEEILKQSTRGSQGDATTAEQPAAQQGPSVGDVLGGLGMGGGLMEILKGMLGGGSTSSRQQSAPAEQTSVGGLGINDMLKMLKNMMGGQLDVEGLKAGQSSQISEVLKQAVIGSALTSVLKNLGVNTNNLNVSNLAQAILRTIGLAGGAMESAKKSGLLENNTTEEA